MADDPDDLIRRSARRAAVRRHHPDAGGSVDGLMAALAAAEGDTAKTVEVVRTRRGRLRRISARLARRVRRRRYVTLRDSTIRDNDKNTGGLI